METFNLLKFWRNVGLNTDAVRDTDLDSVKKFVNTVDCVSNSTPETDEEAEDAFFELVLTGPNVQSNTFLKQGKSQINFPESPKDVKTLPIDTKTKPHSPNSILRPAPKFHVCFLIFRKSKPDKSTSKNYSTTNPKHQKHKLSPNAQGKQKEDDSSKPKYLKLMRPLYSRASKRYTEKVRVSDKVSRTSQLYSPSIQSMNLPSKSSEEKQGNRVAVLEAVRKRLGKSRSTASFGTATMNRRDDSLLEQNDGIQGAILHCKRCYSLPAKDCSVLISRTGSEDLPRGSSEELNRWSI